jgi:putative ABC transport system permease protein
MNTPIRSLDLLDLVWAMGLVALCLGLVRWQQLKLGGQIAIAVGRAVLQLLVMGFGIQLTWQLANPLILGAVIFGLAILTSIAASNRISDRVTGLLPIVSGAIIAGVTVALVYTVIVVIKPDRFDRPEYWLAGAGICLGALLNSTAIAGETLIATISQNANNIETHLHLGASPSQAIAPYRRQAMNAAIVPTINSLSIAGLVTLPNFFSGALLSQITPINAAGYQIIFSIAVLASTITASTLVTLGISRRYFNQFAQFIDPL